MMQSPDKAIRRATMVAKGLAKEIGPLPTGDHPKPPHPASMIPGVHVTGMGDEHTAIPDGYADGGDVGDMPEPQKTVKAYKLFKTKNGKLYPLFVNANKPVPVGQWLTAEEGPQGKSQGRVKVYPWRSGIPSWLALWRPSCSHAHWCQVACGPESARHATVKPCVG